MVSIRNESVDLVYFVKIHRSPLSKAGYATVVYQALTTMTT